MIREASLKVCLVNSCSPVNEFSWVKNVYKNKKFIKYLLEVKFC